MILNMVPSMGLGPCQTNLTVTARAGTTVTASGTIHTKGSYATLIGTTLMDSYGFYVSARGASVSGALHNILVDIAVGDSPSGGSENIIVPNLGCGGAAAIADGGTFGKAFYFPLHIPAGVSVRARSQANTASKTCQIAIWLIQDVFHPWFGGLCDAYGVNAAASRGTSVTRGSGAFGTWTQIVAATTRAHRFWTVAMDGLADATQADLDNIVQVGHGPDSANVTPIFETTCGEDGSEAFFGPLPQLGYFPLPVGERIWVRCASGGTEARGFIVYGVD